jgi:hypothetical protein
VVLLLCDEISCLLCRQMAAMKEPHSKVMHADSFFTTTTLPSNSKTPLQHPPRTVLEQRVVMIHFS